MTMADYSDGTWKVPLSKVLEVICDREPTEVGREALKRAIKDVEELALIRGLVAERDNWRYRYSVHEKTWRELVNGTA
jgi:hypothetical protein